MAPFSCGPTVIFVKCALAWIADRDRFSYEALNSDARLTAPMIKQGGAWKQVDWTTALEYVANEAMQVLGGAGYLRGSKVERIYRETKVLTIGGGSLEIMKDLAARQMGL